MLDVMLSALKQDTCSQRLLHKHGKTEAAGVMLCDFSIIAFHLQPHFW